MKTSTPSLHESVILSEHYTSTSGLASRPPLAHILEHAFAQEFHCPSVLGPYEMGNENAHLTAL
jgi:hypothetical protein